MLPLPPAFIRSRSLSTCFCCPRPSFGPKPLLMLLLSPAFIRSEASPHAPAVPGRHSVRSLSTCSRCPRPSSGPEIIPDLRPRVHIRSPNGRSLKRSTQRLSSRTAPTAFCASSTAFRASASASSASSTALRASSSAFCASSTALRASSTALSTSAEAV